MIVSVLHTSKIPPSVIWISTPECRKHPYNRFFITAESMHGSVKGLRRPNDPGNSLSVGPYGAEIAPPQVKPEPAVHA